MNHLTVENALLQLHENGNQFLDVFSHGTLKVEIYKPEKVDTQTPHSRDEVYVIASGNGFFIHNEVRKSIKTGDFIFVPAKDAHNFEDFSDDFSTWVFFYGPEGGEANK